MISQGKAEAFFAGRSVEFTLDSKKEKWIVSSFISSKKDKNKQVIKEFFPGRCKARFTSKNSYLFLEDEKTLYLRQEFSQKNRYVVFREMFTSYLQEVEDWSMFFSSNSICLNDV